MFLLYAFAIRESLIGPNAPHSRSDEMAKLSGAKCIFDFIEKSRNSILRFRSAFPNSLALRFGSHAFASSHLSLPSPLAQLRGYVNSDYSFVPNDNSLVSRFSSFRAVADCCAVVPVNFCRPITPCVDSEQFPLFPTEIRPLLLSPHSTPLRASHLSPIASDRSVQLSSCVNKPLTNSLPQQKDFSPKSK